MDWINFLQKWKSMYSKRLYKQASNYSQNADFTNSWRPFLTDFPVYTHAIYVLCVRMDLLHWSSEFVRLALINHISCRHSFSALPKALMHSNQRAFQVYADWQPVCINSPILKSFHLHACILLLIRFCFMPAINLYQVPYVWSINTDHIYVPYLWSIFIITPESSFAF